MRQIININNNWKFIKNDISNAYEKNIETNNWENVTIPHTWNNIDGASGVEFYRGACWYRKNFTLSKSYSNKKIFIEFCGSNSVTDVYINGVHLGKHEGGYSTFRFDITNFVNFNEENTISVKVDNSAFEDIYPLMADFTFYGGIYRNVNLIVTEDIHFDLMNEGSKGVFVSQDEITNEYAKLTIKANIVNHNSDEQAIRVVANVFDSKGNIVKYNAKDILVDNSSEVLLPITIENPTLWNSVDNPYLYNIQVSVEKHNDLVDELSISTGLRYFHFDPKEGFFLNGKHLKLKGVSRHQDKCDKGWALTKEDHELDMQLIKEVGANSIRLAHYQHDQYFYDLCDKEGMIIWAEIPFISRASDKDLSGRNAKSQMVELIRQNYNHPSIVMWGVQNEIQIGGDLPYVRNIVKDLNELAHKEDSTRLTTQAHVAMLPDVDEYNDYTDVIAYNKYFGWYTGKTEELANWLDEFHKLNPDKCVGLSEYGVEGIITYHSDTPTVKDYTEEYHALYHETVLKIFNERPFVWGTYAWNFFDFGSSIRDEGGVKGRNNKGLMTFDRKIKKDAFFAYKAVWSNEPFVHICSKRFIERATETINLKVYSNCDEVTLYLNGEKLNTLSDKHTFVFNNLKLVSGQNHLYAVAKKGYSTFTDYALFNKVDEPNKVYICSDKKDSPVANWFDESLVNSLSDIEITELEITDDVFSTATPMCDILENQDATKVLEKYLTGLMSNPNIKKMGKTSIDDIRKMLDGAFDDKLIFVINKELTKINK
ncbi:MAG: glycoside hydrolase family 2 TIM barrel-domain containing protein [Peptostreptococcaceae bacterium]